ncbi:MAG: M28 family peptidase [Planctomycetota bacterium]
MKTSLRLLPFLLLPAACTSAPAPDITAEELSDHVRWLADDAQEGRRTGEPGAYRSADYLAKHLAEAGLEPAGDNGTYFQEFEVRMPAVEGASMMTVDGVAIEHVGTVAASPNTAVEGPLAYAGYGIVFESHGINDYAFFDATDKIVLVRRYTEFGVDADPQLASLGNLRKKIRNAAAAGAVGIVLGTHPDDIAAGGKEILGFKAVQGAMPIPVVTVDAKTFGQLETRWMQRGLAAQVDMKPEVVRETRIARNVLAKVPGALDEWITVGAHYDHLGYGGQGSLAPGVHAIHNGADDNASGSAMTLELAETYAQRAAIDGPPVRGLLFCFWSGEELGLLGSAHWVENPTLPLDDVLCNLNLDMIGRLEAGRVTVGSGFTGAAFQPALKEVQAELVAQGIGLEMNVVEGELPGGGGSDHMSFHKVEIPAVFFFSGLHSDYHKPSDDWEKVTFPQMQELSAALVSFLDRMQTPAVDQFVYLKPKAAEGGGKERSVRSASVWFGSIPDYGAMPDTGMQISGTSPGGPAEKAGLLPGDVIVQIGEFPIGDIYDFMDTLAEFQDGDTIDVTVVRDGKEKKLPLTFFPRPSSEG